jgi:uncharacterized protein YgfB (UPF0149 family)
MKISITVKDMSAAKLKSQLYGLLCEYEKERDWEAFLDSIIIELLGYPEEEKTASYYTLFHKVSSLRYLSYKYFRTTIFDCMNLISKEQNHE